MRKYYFIQIQFLIKIRNETSLPLIKELSIFFNVERMLMQITGKKIELDEFCFSSNYKKKFITPVYRINSVALKKDDGIDIESRVKHLHTHLFYKKKTG